MTDTDYLVAIEDLFVVPGDEVDSSDAAERYVLERLGEDQFVASEARVVDREDILGDDDG